ncbi:Heme exporter protein B [gamma proteobacterium HdN1]|nr:Heme exporter protein B [gamma proteobacterium HdN1]
MTIKRASLPPLLEAASLPPLSQGFGALLRRDLLLASRQRSDLIYPVFFFFMVVSLFPLGIGPDGKLLAKTAPGILWIAALLSTLLATDSLFRQDYDDGTLEILLSSPQSSFVFVTAKVLAHWLVASLPLLLFAPLIAVMLHLDGRGIGILLASLALGTPILSLISAIGASLTVGLRRGSMLVALIALPLYVPVLIFAVGAVETATLGGSVAGHIGYLAAMLVLAVTLAPFAIAAGLAISVKA